MKAHKRRPRTLVVLLGVLALFVLPAATRVNEPASAEARQDGQREIKVMSFNLRDADLDEGNHAWSARRSLALGLIQEQAADIIGFQEVVPQQRADLNDDLPNRHSDGTGRDVGGAGEQCPIYWKDSLSVTDSGTFWLSPTPLAEGSVGWDASAPRVCTWARWHGVTLFNVHLDDVGATSRRQALQLIRRRAQGSCIIMGDFNEREKSVGLEPMEGLVDAYRSLHPHTRDVTTYHGFKGDDFTGPKIDFIYVSPDIQVLSADIIHSNGPVFPSDHYPITARLRLPHRTSDLDHTHPTGGDLQSYAR